MKKKSLVRILSIFLMTFLVSFPAISNELELLKGKVKIRSRGSDMIYDKTGQKVLIFNGDQIQTGRDSQVRIDLKEQGDAIELHSFSFFEVAIGEENIDKMVLPIGKARFKVKARKGVRKKRFRVRTGNALVGVKGTEWVMSSGEGDTSVLTISGVVSLANILAPEISVDVTENQASRIEQNKLPTAPVTVPPEVRDRVTTSDSRKAFSTITYGSVITVTKEQLQQMQKKSQPADNQKDGNSSKEEQGSDGDKSDQGGEEGQGPAGEGETANDTDTAEGDFAGLDLDEPEVEEPEIDIDDIIDEIDEITTEIEDEQASAEIEAIEIQILH